jgi:fluoride exporter
MTARNLIGVALGALIGATLRWLAVALAPVGSPTWALVAVNGAGCLLMGYSMGTETGRPQDRQLLLTAGLCGALTTMAGFAVDTASLLDASRWSSAVAYVAATACVSFGGFEIGRRADDINRTSTR